MHVAVDGSILIEQPGSPSSLHLVEWLYTLNDNGAQVSLLHPQGKLPQIPVGIASYSIQQPIGTWSRLKYVLRDLPQAAGELLPDLLVVSSDRAPLKCPCPIIVVPSIGGDPKSRGIVDKLTFAVGRAGTRGARAVLFPSDLEVGSGYAPFVSPSLIAEKPAQQDPCVLCYGFKRKDIAMILSAWTWVEGSLGDSYPLIFAGMHAPEVQSIASELDVETSVRAQPDVSFSNLSRLYASAEAFIGTAFEAGGQALRWALATGTPVVGIQTPQFESVLGGAAYLVPPGDSRTLGAASLTVLIQERVSDPLKDRGRQRAAEYVDPRRGEELVELLRELGKRSV